MYPPKHFLQLVGRSQEKKVLRTLLDSAKQSQGQTAFIVGEAGIGKTRLLASLISLAETNGFTVIRGECIEQDQDFPYAPVIDGLRTHFSAIPSGELDVIIDPFQSEIIKLLPELALHYGEKHSAAPLESDAEKRRLFEVLMQVYHRLAASGLLLIFEDVHWCDTNSLEFFQTLTRRIGKLPILVALSSRFTAPDSEVGKLRVYFDRARNAQSIHLNPLTANEIEALVKTVLQTTYAIHPNLLERLNTLAEGNPLHTEQIVYLLLHNRQLNLVNNVWMITSSTNAVDIPTSIKRMVAQQMVQLSEDARLILRLAAVAGRHFELDTLRSLTGFNDAQLTSMMKALLQQRFLEEVSRDRFVFRHDLLRQTIYDDLLIRERQELHRSLLHILEESEATQIDIYLADLSHHAYQAEAWDAALHYGFQAGQHALALHSPRAAVEHFSHAIEAANRLDDRASWELYMQRGKAFDSLGEFQYALDDYQSALKVAEQRGDQTARWQTLIAMALLWAARDYDVSGDYCERALQLAQSMEEPRLIGHSLNRLGNWYLNTGQPYDALNYHEQALALFEDIHDLPGKGETLDLLGMTSQQILRFEAAQYYYRDASAIFRELDDRQTLASSLTNLALITLNPPLAEEAADIAREIGWYSGEAYAYLCMGYVHSAYGHFTQSLSYLQRGLDLAQAIDHMQWLAGAHMWCAFAYKDMLELATAADHAEHCIALATKVGSQWFSDTGSGLLARILIEQQQLDAAEVLLAQHPVPDPPAMQHMMLMLAEVELALAHGQAEAALTLNERMGDMLSLMTGSGVGGTFTLIPYLILQARAYVLLDRPADALAALQQARRICEDWGLLPLLWQVEVLLAQVATHEDETDTAQTFQKARDTINQIVEYVPADLRQRFRQNAEKFIPARGTKRMSIASPHQLTQREMDVVREVALGKSNQQIAADLHITVKTVEAHITRVLSKLNLSSRTQIALWSVDNKLTPPPE